MLWVGLVNDEPWQNPDKKGCFSEGCSYLKAVSYFTRRYVTNDTKNALKCFEKCLVLEIILQTHQLGHLFFFHFRQCNCMLCFGMGFLVTNRKKSFLSAGAFNTLSQGKDYYQG